MFRLQGRFSHVSSLIVQEPHAETTEVTTDHGFVLKLAISVDMNKQNAWIFQLLFCWDTTFCTTLIFKGFFVHLRQVWAQCRKMKVLASTDNFFGSWPGHLKGRHIGEGLKWQRKDPGTNEGRAWYVYKFLLQPLALVCSMRNVDILLWTRIWNDLPP